MHRTTSFVLVVVLYLMPACSDHASDPNTYQVSGKVVGAKSNQGLSNATLTLVPSNVSVVTDSAGSFRLSVVAPGNYVLMVQRSGFFPDSLVVDLTSESMTNMEIRLKYMRVTNHLLAYFPFDSTVVDSNASGIAGNAYGAVLTTDRFGNTNSAYMFDGINDYLSLDESPILDPAAGSIAVWMRSSIQTLNQKLIFGQGQGRPQVIMVSGVARIQWGATDLSFPGATSISRIDGGGWHFLVGVWSTNSFKIYVDGVLEDSFSTILMPKDSDCPTQIGGFNQPLCGGAYFEYIGQFFAGKIDDVSLYNKELTQQEITTIMNER